MCVCVCVYVWGHEQQIFISDKFVYNQDVFNKSLQKEVLKILIKSIFFRELFNIFTRKKISSL